MNHEPSLLHHPSAICPHFRPQLSSFSLLLELILPPILFRHFQKFSKLPYPLYLHLSIIQRILLVPFHCIPLSTKPRLKKSNSSQFALHTFIPIHDKFHIMEVLFVRHIELNVTHHCKSKSVTFIFHIEDV